ncbi:MAG: FAD-dependent oxidoreductase [Lachnospiraceae bacterium]|nr:FAD-dependent oxidoreductase [Lachnospiraceae bacterium]
MKVIIIGGVAAGTKVAAKLKREDRSAEVTILTKGKDISYAGCGLPYYVGKVIPDRESLVVNTPEKFAALTGARVVTGMEVTKLDRAAKTVEAVHENGEMSTWDYDKLVIATGASPIRPALPGLDLPQVFFMRTPDDAVSLRAAVEAGGIKKAVVVGGGFIGLEIAENLTSMGVRCNVLDMAPHVLPGFDEEVQVFVENHLAEHGIHTMTGTRFEGVLGEGKVEKVQTDRRALKADMVVLSIGIRANTAFLADTGIELAPNRTVLVNDHMQTNDPDIYAVGDCAMVTNRITGAAAWSPMGSTANITGRMAAKNMAGKDTAYHGAMGTAVCQLPKLNAGRTGMSEAQAKEAGFDAVSVIMVTDDKAHYMPGADSFIIKLIADRESRRLLGVQVLGKGAVDKVVDTCVAAIAMKATVDEIADMDFAYAPPFSTAIHPLAHAVNVLMNKMDGTLETMTPAEYAAGEAEGYKVMDVSPQPSIAGAPYVDLTKIEGEVDGFAKDEPILLVCAKGKRGYMTQNRMKYYGYTNTKVLEGGLTFNEVEAE